MPRTKNIAGGINARIGAKSAGMALSDLKKLANNRIKKAQKQREEHKLVLWAPRPQNKPQQEAYNSPADRLYYGGAAGCGKASLCYGYSWALDNIPHFTGDNYKAIMHQVPYYIRCMDSKVLMWDGQWKEFSAVSVGDRIMNPDGQTQEVLNVFNTGKKPAFRFRFEDGTTAECSEDHLWGFWEARANSRRKTSGGVKEIFSNETPIDWNFNYISRARVRDASWLYKEVSKGRTFIIPISAPLNFTNLHRGNADRAYFYGAMLGDGCIKTPGANAYSFCSADRWIIERIYPLLENYYEYQRKDPNNGELKEFWSLTLKDRWIDMWARNNGLLGKYSHEKFIPPGYLKESLKFRWNLAQGLFDTDGTVDKDRTRVSYATVSKQLAEDVANLVRSLGFLAKISIRPEKRIIREDGSESIHQKAYIVNVQGNQKHRLFSLPRKVERSTNREAMNWVGKRIESIEPIPAVDGKCIKVSNPNSLYITDGYNVTHNSDLGLGLAITSHCDSIIYRTTYPELESLEERAQEIIGDLDTYNQSKRIFKKIPGNKKVPRRTLQFAAVQHEKDRIKFQGRPKDLIVLDEAPNFRKSVFDFITGWNRPSSRAPRDQRCRIVCTGNPPTTPEGRWVVEYWAPWLDNEHELYPYPPGELIWFVSIGGENIIVATGKEKPPDYAYTDPNDTSGKVEYIEPHSRTFIPALLSDNPDLDTPEYRATLQAMPEPLRSQMLFGDFNIGTTDDPWQVIPSDWVELAFQRWREMPDGSAMQMTSMGVDVARGGEDSTVISILRDNYYDELLVFPGQSTPDGPKVAAQVLQNYTSGHVNVDAVSVGGAVYDALVGTLPVFPISSNSATKETSKNGNLGFYNERAKMYWRLREALDPDFGSNICLPPNNRLKAELCAARWEVKAPSSSQKSITSGAPLIGQIKIWPKEEIEELLGRSPDLADAVVYALNPPPKKIKSAGRSSVKW